MSVSGCPGEVGQMPDITVRPPSSVNNLLDLYRAQQLALILRCQARLYGAMQFTHVALTHRCIKNAGRHLDDDNAGDNPGMRSNACAQPFIGLNFLDEHPAQRTLLRGIAHVLIKHCHVAYASKQLLALWLVESAGRHLDQDIWHGETSRLTGGAIGPVIALLDK